MAETFLRYPPASDAHGATPPLSMGQRLGGDVLFEPRPVSVDLLLQPLPERLAQFRFQDLPRPRQRQEFLPQYHRPRAFVIGDQPVAMGDQCLRCRLLPWLQPDNGMDPFAPC